MFEGPKQLAYAVGDVHVAAAEWAATGVGPWFVREHIELASARIHGADSTFDHSSAYGWSGDVMIELIHQHDGGPDAIVGTSGLHHVAYFVDDLEAAASELVGRGRTEVLRATVASGMGFAFHDARHDLGHLIEIYEPVPGLLGFYDMVRAASTDWTRDDPVRIL